MQTENYTPKLEDSPKQVTGEGCPEATCSRLFRVQVTFDTVIYAEDEKVAKQKVKYGTGEIDDMPVSVLATPIESLDGLPAGWNAECLPWGDVPLPSKTIGEILNANRFY